MSALADIEAFLRNLRQIEVQALHAGLSERSWYHTEVAANRLRDRIDALLGEIDFDRNFAKRHGKPIPSPSSSGDES